MQISFHSPDGHILPMAVSSQDVRSEPARVRNADSWILQQTDATKVVLGPPDRQEVVLMVIGDDAAGQRVKTAIETTWQKGKGHVTRLENVTLGAKISMGHAQYQFRTGTLVIGS